MSISPRTIPPSLPSFDTSDHSPFSTPSPSPHKMSPFSKDPLLPGPVLASSPRRTARRVSYTLKNRMSQYSLPLSIGLFVTGFLFYLSYSNGSYLPSFGSASAISERDQQIFNDGGFIRENNGLSFLEEHADELIAEDDLFWDAYKEKQAKTATEQKEMEEMESRRQDVLKTNNKHSIRALMWWISQGGILPNDYKVPSKEEIDKLGPNGMERALEMVDNGTEGDEIFEEGWVAFAEDRYRAVVFSKSYCPYSKNAKSILEQYRLIPPPYIVELDRRPDTAHLQGLLQHLTGRRTVPNIIFDFESIGGSDELTLIHGEGGLQRLFQDKGMIAGWGWRREKDFVQAINLEDLDDNIPAHIRAQIERRPEAEAEANKVADAEEVVDSDADF